MSLGRTLLLVAIYLFAYLPLSYSETNIEELKHSINYDLRENAHCQVPYSVTRWKYAFCMTSLESDDIDNTLLQSCLKQIEKSAPSSADPCDSTMFYKRKWCEVSFERGYVLNVNSCVSDGSLFPSALEQGF